MKRGKFEAEKSPKQEKEKQVLSTSQSVLLYLHDLTYLLCIILLIILLCLRIVIVSGDSMNNTLVDGDYVLLLSNSFYHNPKQGDIIVASKDSFRSGEPIIKRIIAVEGQKVDIDFYNGIVYVDDVALDEPYICSKTDLNEGIIFPLVVEEGCVFVLGDNRAKSEDSRSVQIGMIDNREIIGKAIILFFPGDDQGEQIRDFSRIGGLR